MASKELNTADDDVAMLAEVAARYKYWWRTNDGDKKILDDFELLTRDLSTRLHALAKEKGLKIHHKVNGANLRAVVSKALT